MEIQHCFWPRKNCVRQNTALQENRIKGGVPVFLFSLQFQLEFCWRGRSTCWVHHSYYLFNWSSSDLFGEWTQCLRYVRNLFCFQFKVGRAYCDTVLIELRNCVVIQYNKSTQRPYVTLARSKFFAEVALSLEFFLSSHVAIS